MNNSINRLVRFDIAKAICIVLVALGHFNRTTGKSVWIS